MITFFHNFANTWGAKFIFVVLALCMIVWFGLGSFVDLNPMAEKAVIVGSKSTTVQQVMNDFEAQRKKVSQMTGGRYFSPEQALSSGLLLQVIGQQVSDLVAANIRDEIGLTASNAAVQKYVERNPVFADVTGRFDKNLFYAYLAQNQMTEAMLGTKLADELALRHLTDTIGRLGYAPQELVRLMYNREHEKRDVTALLVETDKIPVTEKPTEAVLREYYEAEAENLMAPEYRALNIVLITPEMMLNKITISDEETDAVFDEEKTKYITPETRQVFQMRFDSADAAKAVKQKVTPATFEKTAADELGQTPDQTNFGAVTRDGLLEELGEAVFTATAGTIVGPVQSPVGYHLFYVKSITPATTLPDAQIRAEIKKRLAMEKTYDVQEETVRRLEDALGSGTSLKNAAEKEGLSVVEVPQIDIAGQTPEGDALPDDLKNTEMLQNAFILQKGESTALTEQGAGFIVAEVTDITPVAQKPFEAVKQEMTALWTADQQKEKLKEIVETALDVTKQGNPLEAQGLFAPFEKIAVTGMTRTNFGRIPAEAVPLIMSQPVGRTAVRSFDLPNGTLVFVTDKVIPADPDKDTLGFKATAQTLKTLSGEALAQQTVAAFAKEFGVTVNEAEINKAFSIYKTQE